MAKKSRIYLGLTSTQGDRVAHLRTAVAHLNTVVQIERCANLYVITPLGASIAPDSVISTVVEGTTALQPLSLLKALKGIERLMGRSSGPAYDIYGIDIDILFYDLIIIEALELHIPHIHLPERPYVLKPLAELVPNMIHPVFCYTIAELLRDVSEAESVQLYNPHLATATRSPKSKSIGER